MQNFKQLQMENPKVYHFEKWHNLSEPQKLDVIKGIIESYGRDPRIATKCIQILRQANVAPRDYIKQAKVLLDWVQHQIYYVNEPGERLQSPMYTLKVGYGDCDDMVIVLCSFFEAIKLPWKLVLSGASKTGKKRYIHGDRFRRDAAYSHIYCMVGDRPFSPTKWFYCEPTIRGVPLGWDVIEADDNSLPELLSPTGKQLSGPNGISHTAFAVGGSVAEESTLGTDVKQIIKAAIVGSLTAVLSEILLRHFFGRK